MLSKCFLCLSFLLSNIAYCNPIASISSSVGDFDIELFDDAAPLTVANFIRYAESGGIMALLFIARYRILSYRVVG